MINWTIFFTCEWLWFGNPESYGIKRFMRLSNMQLTGVVFVRCKQLLHNTQKLSCARYFPRKIYTFPWARNFMSIASTSDRAMQVIGSSKLH